MKNYTVQYNPFIKTSSFSVLGVIFTSRVYAKKDNNKHSIPFII
jgi:hypothetical protein